SSHSRRLSRPIPLLQTNMTRPCQAAATAWSPTRARIWRTQQPSRSCYLVTCARRVRRSSKKSGGYWCSISDPKACGIAETARPLAVPLAIDLARRLADTNVSVKFCACEDDNFWEKFENRTLSKPPSCQLYGYGC